MAHEEKRKKKSPASGTVRLEPEQSGALAQGTKCRSRRGSLLVIGGSEADLGTHLLIEGEVRIGREDTELRLCDGGISRTHALVLQQDSDIVIRDLGSTNGTQVNGVRLTADRRLVEGDQIRIGKTLIKFTLVDEAEAAYLRQVQQRVGTDELTGLLSKPRFDASLTEAIAVARASGAPLSALMMDMDGLKAINDRHGHHAGADTIRQVGGLIGRLLHGRGEACRFGGDEFSAFLRSADLPTALRVAEEIRSGVAALSIAVGAVNLTVSISIGVAERPAEVGDYRKLIRLADEALYRAKKKGRNIVSD